jgi:hypothetical protein
MPERRHDTARSSTIKASQSVLKVEDEHRVAPEVASDSASTN